MKHLFLLSTLLIMICMTSCQKEEVQTIETDLNEFNDAGYSAYIAKHVDVIVEHATLDELNSVYAENGLTPLAEKDFSPEEWVFLQNDSPRANQRCSSGYSVYLGDMNDSGTLSTWDLVLANIFINAGGSTVNTSNLADEYQKFGRFSHWHGMGGLNFLTSLDVTLARRHILGIYPC